MAIDTDDKKAAKLLGMALSFLRNQTGLSGAQAADRYEDLGHGKMSAQNWSKYERGAAPGIFKPDVQRKLTDALGATPDDLALAKGDIEAAGRIAKGEDPHIVRLRPKRDSRLVIRDRVMAGAWLAADDYLDRVPRTFAAVRDERFPYADQWLSEVVGDSMDRAAIFDGDLVHFVDAVAIHYLPKSGDIVEVERVRFGGRERELSVKQVEVTGAEGVLLWPRSNNPKWKDPLPLHQGIANDEEIEVRIRGLAIASIHRFRT